jgi:hypothetical protein
MGAPGASPRITMLGSDAGFSSEAVNGAMSRVIQGDIVVACDFDEIANEVTGGAYLENHFAIDETIAVRLQVVAQ